LDENEELSEEEMSHSHSRITEEDNFADLPAVEVLNDVNKD
jgi:hypothetical protein